MVHADTGALLSGVAGDAIVPDGGSGIVANAYAAAVVAGCDAVGDGEAGKKAVGVLAVFEEYNCVGSAAVDDGPSHRVPIVGIDRSELDVASVKLDILEIGSGRDDDGVAFAGIVDGGLYLGVNILRGGVPNRIGLVGSDVSELAEFSGSAGKVVDPSVNKIGIANVYAPTAIIEIVVVIIGVEKVRRLGDVAVESGLIGDVAAVVGGMIIVEVIVSYDGGSGVLRGVHDIYPRCAGGINNQIVLDDG